MNVEHRRISDGRPTRTQRRYQVRSWKRGRKTYSGPTTYHRYRWTTYLVIWFWSASGSVVEFWDMEAPPRRQEVS